jgi:hypothetical protein
MKVIAFKNEEEYYHVVRKIKKMKKFLTELCNVIEESHDSDEYEDEDDETVVYKNGVAYRVQDDDYEIQHRRGKMKGGRFSY